jgi:hypothetical protein
MSAGFRVTVEDLATGEKQSRVVSEGDYMLIPFAPCYLHSAQRYGNGTVSVTLKGHSPRAVEQVVSRDV